MATGLTENSWNLLANWCLTNRERIEKVGLARAADIASLGPSALLHNKTLSEEGWTPIRGTFSPDHIRQGLELAETLRSFRDGG